MIERQQLQTRFFSCVLFASLNAAGLVTIPICNGQVQEKDVNKILVELFVNGDEEESEQASEVLNAIAVSRQGIEVKIVDVDTEMGTARLDEVADQNANIPAVYACGKFVQGMEKIRKVHELFKVRFYTRDRCPLCKEAKIYLADLAKQWPGMEVLEFNVRNHPSAKRRVDQLGGGRVPCFEVGHSAIGFYFIKGFDASKKTQLEGIFKSH